MNRPLDWSSREPYPPRNADEVRLSIQMDRIEQKLDIITSKLREVEAGVKVLSLNFAQHLLLEGTSQKPDDAQ